jgi:hypothetical protein
MMILEVKLSFDILKSLIGVRRSKRYEIMNIEYRLTNADFRSEIVLWVLNIPDTSFPQNKNPEIRRPLLA